MSNSRNCNNQPEVDDFEDDEIFDDSTFMSNFANTSFNTTNKSHFPENNLNNAVYKNDLNVSALCCDEELHGYDKISGKTWIYPTNYPVRDYQFNIINAALVKNTLVSLPTGLGKTFIAAVIMYNFYRWYPLGKIVFTAPTRPLVAQQIDACYNIVAIPPRDTIEMTGHMKTSTRKIHWQNKRVFFATPQVIHNDIKSGICPGDQIRCLVIDEAHRARKNYAYCQIINALDDIGHKRYRILALSATPGSKVDDVVSVVRSLHIANLELRSEECIDVARYSHSRKINTVIIPLGPELTHLKQKYVEILDCYARRLKQLNILPQNIGNLSKGRIVMMYKEFQAKERSNRHPQHNYIMKDFTMLIGLYHGLELLTRHGSRVFLNFFDDHPEKSWIQSDDKLTGLLENLRDEMGVNPMSLDTSILPDGTIPEMPSNLNFGHPKFCKLKEIMLEHFTAAKQKGQDTRAIVFCEYRESVNLVHRLLLQCRPLITPQTFVGQGASGKEGKTVVSQKQQLRVMRAFRAGECNALVATCVAEEGLDVGSVDLILCFDISTKSPVRLVQRCGRTGRERGGQVHILVTEGREHQTLLDCMRQRDGLNTKILHSNDIQENLYKSNPRMMPHDFTPKCQMMHITVEKKSETKTNVINKKGQKNIRSMFLTKASTSSITSNKLKGKEGVSDSKCLNEHIEYWEKDQESFITDICNERIPNMSKQLEIQGFSQDIVNAGSLQNIKSKQNELPVSTNIVASQELSVHLSSPIKSKPNKQKQKLVQNSPGKKNGDIRALFSTGTKSTKSYTKLITDLGIQNDPTVPTSLINLLVDLKLNNSNINKKCYICESICECKIMKNMFHKNKSSLVMNLKEINIPDIDLIGYINVDSINKCRMRESSNKNESYTNETNSGENKVSNFDLEFAMDSQTYTEKVDSNKYIAETIKTTSDNKVTTNFDLELVFDSQTYTESNEIKKDNEKVVDNFDIGELDDIFADDDLLETHPKSSPLETSLMNKEEEEKCENNEKGTLSFFGLDSIEDIFADDYEDSLNKMSQEPKQTEANITDDVEFIDESFTKVASKSESHPLSPSILSGKVKTKEFTSPILCSQKRKFSLSTRKDKQHSSTPINAKKSLQFDTTSTANVSNQSMLTITQLVEMIHKPHEHDKTKDKINTESKTDINDNEDDMCVSPILLTQSERKKSTELNKISMKAKELSQKSSIIILDSDSDSNETLIYDVETEFDKNRNENNSDSGRSTSHNSSNKSTILIQEVQPIATNSKRKLEMDESEIASPYFNKKQKTTHSSNQPESFKEKILAVITPIKANKFDNNQQTFHCSVSQSHIQQKENWNPQFISQSSANTKEGNVLKKNGNLDFLQSYRHEPNRLQQSVMNKFNTIFSNKSPVKSKTPQKRKIAFDDSDDDFILEDKNDFAVSPRLNGSLKTAKVRKKKKQGNSFLDLEAELTDDDRDSGDELSDESIGSIIDFICDENDTQHEDVHALYLKTTKSPVKQGGFKIPALPKKISADVLSQYIEEDSYEMDSFCVDSHIGLTQVNEVSALEVAEMVLEKRRKEKKKVKSKHTLSPQDGDSPIVKRKNKHCKRTIQSDSDDSS